MREIPKLFSAPMVRALLEGRKIMTRRLDGLDEINEQPDAYHYQGTNPDGDHLFIEEDAITAGHDPQTCMKIIPASCRVGDVLCVRETWCTLAQWDNWKPSDLPSSNLTVPIHYLADGPKPAGFGKTRPGIFLPRWAWRIKRPIVCEERCERVQSITWKDALAEGVMINLHEGRPTIRLTGKCPPSDHWKPGDSDEQFIVAHFASLWDTVHGPGAWSKNEWVRVIIFAAGQ